MQKIMEQFSVQVRRSDPREAATDLYCIILLCLFPLFPGFSGYTNITFSKYVFLLAATALWLVALLVLTRSTAAFFSASRSSPGRSRCTSTRSASP